MAVRCHRATEVLTAGEAADPNWRALPRREDTTRRGDAHECVFILQSGAGAIRRGASAVGNAGEHGFLTALMLGEAAAQG